jgi:hypothetical protein
MVLRYVANTSSSSSASCSSEHFRQAARSWGRLHRGVGVGVVIVVVKENNAEDAAHAAQARTAWSTISREIRAACANSWPASDQSEDKLLGLHRWRRSDCEVRYECNVKTMRTYGDCGNPTT